MTRGRDKLTRRGLLETAAAAGVLTALPPIVLAKARPRHQPGIATPMQRHLEFAAFDVPSTGTDKAAVRDLMRDWTRTIARLKHRDNLTVTVGFGPRLAGIHDLPPFRGDQLDPNISGGDLALQICADDPQAAKHALQQFHGATEKWHVSGFHRQNRRNDLGFKDGTNNIAGDDQTAMRHSVWVGPRDDPRWLRGGAYLVARRIRIDLDAWNGTPTSDQERVIGRHKRSGAPLGKTHEHDEMDLDAGVAEGNPVIPTDAHIRLSSPEANGGKMLLRRSYNFEDGLFFLAYMRHPRQFVQVQRRLAGNSDALGRFIVHEGSALFACGPAPRKGGFVGDTLLR
jgi:deferrochelatase/peroxidase EfeB